MKHSTSHQGIILVVTLWLLFLISFLTIQYSKSVRQRAKLSIGLKGKILGYYMAQSAIVYAQRMLVVSQDLVEPTEGINPWQPDGKLRPAKLEGQSDVELKVGVEPETEKLDLNTATSDQIFDLISALDIPEQTANIITDSIIDWRDGDKLLRPHGAEDEYYQRAGCNYTPPNKPFRCLEELLLVRGIDYELFWERPGLWQYFTIYNPQGKKKSASEMVKETTKEKEEETESLLKLENNVTYRFIVKGIVKNVHIFYISWQLFQNNKWQKIEERFY